MVWLPQQSQGLASGKSGATDARAIESTKMRHHQKHGLFRIINSLLLEWGLKNGDLREKGLSSAYSEKTPEGLHLTIPHEFRTVGNNLAERQHKRRQQAAALIEGALEESIPVTRALAQWPTLPRGEAEDTSLQVAYRALWHFYSDDAPISKEAFYLDVQLALLRQIARHLNKGEDLPLDLLMGYASDSSLETPKFYDAAAPSRLSSLPATKTTLTGWKGLISKSLRDGWHLLSSSFSLAFLPNSSVQYVTGPRAEATQFSDSSQAEAFNYELFPEANTSASTIYSAASADKAITRSHSFASSLHIAQDSIRLAIPQPLQPSLETTNGSNVSGKPSRPDRGTPTKSGKANSAFDALRRLKGLAEETNLYTAYSSLAESEPHATGIVNKVASPNPVYEQASFNTAASNATPGFIEPFLREGGRFSPTPQVPSSHGFGLLRKETAVDISNLKAPTSFQKNPFAQATSRPFYKAGTQRSSGTPAIR